MSKDSDVSLINTFYQYFLNQTVFELLKFPGFFPYIIIAKFTEVYCKKGVLRSFTKFTWKHLWMLWSSPFLQNTSGQHLRKLRNNYLRKETLSNSKTVWFQKHWWKVFMSETLEIVKEVVQEISVKYFSKTCEIRLFHCKSLQLY